MQLFLVRFTILDKITLLLLGPLIRDMRAQTSSDSTVEFKKLAAQLSTARLDGAAESEASEEMALGILDKLAVAVFDRPTFPVIVVSNPRRSDFVFPFSPVWSKFSPFFFSRSSPSFSFS